MTATTSTGTTSVVEAARIVTTKMVNDHGMTVNITCYLKPKEL